MADFWDSDTLRFQDFLLCFVAVFVGQGRSTMTIRSRVAAVLLSVAAGGATLTAPPARAAVAYLDAAAWLSAAGSLGPVMLVPFSLHNPVFRDDFGAYTTPGEVWIDTPSGFSFPSDWYSRSLGFFAPTLGPDTIEVHFKCAEPVYPCLGVNGFEAAFDRPILGFGGAFTWHIGYGDFEHPVDVAGQVLTWDGPLAPVDGGDPRIRHGFLGFIGAMDTLRIDWLVNSADDFASVRWTAPFAIVAAVPEPSAAVLLAGALAALAAIGAA
ncbi:hypothetical protein FK498_18820, partial [Elioraea sp. Yellowstone]|uniref:hypothetical protein n=1 Tax=Elioraea sp. Yellowstone TaxID=2592070 RepID=UPI00114F5DA5